MPKSGISIYQMSRNRAKMSREDAADSINISPRQLARYESTDPDDMTQPPDDVVAIMMEVYDDLNLGYRHLMQSPVARKLLPELPVDIDKMSLLHRIVKLGHKCTHFTNQVFTLQEAAMDNEISADEMPLWEDAQSDATDLIGAALGITLLNVRNRDES